MHVGHAAIIAQLQGIPIKYFMYRVITLWEAFIDHVQEYMADVGGDVHAGTDKGGLNIYCMFLLLERFVFSGSGFKLGVHRI